MKYPNERFPTREVVSPSGRPSTIVTDTPEDWCLIGLKTIEAFKFILKNYDFDYIFRTNTSSYLDTRQLLKYLEDQPKSGLYSGVIDQVFGSMKFVSGAGILMSKDVVQRVCEKEDNWKHGLADDVALSSLVAELRNPSDSATPLKRLDLLTLDAARKTEAEVISGYFHLRCKGESAGETVKIMQYVHSVKNPDIKN
jgi:hypothetical protein